MRFGRQSFLAVLLLVPVLIVGLSSKVGAQLPPLIEDIGCALVNPDDQFPIDLDATGEKWNGTMTIYWPYVGTSEFDRIGAESCEITAGGSPLVVDVHFFLQLSRGKKNIDFGGFVGEVCLLDTQKQADEIKIQAAKEFSKLFFPEVIVDTQVGLDSVTDVVFSDSDLGVPSDPLYMHATVGIRVNR